MSNHSTPFKDFLLASDMTKCKNKKCKDRLSCYRYMGKSDRYWQSYFTKNDKYNKEECEHYYPYYIWRDSAGKPYLLKEVYSASTNKEDVFGDLVYATEVKKLGTIDVDSKYIDRVRLGLNQVVTNGLGYGYMGNYLNSSGKTGTSQSFIDNDNNGVVDTETISTSFVGYSPSDNPKMSIVVVSPDIATPEMDYQSSAPKRIPAKLVNNRRKQVK